MKHFYKFFAIILFGLAGPGCSTIYFHQNSNDKNSDKTIQYSEWHHDGIFGLVEFSDNVDMSNRCRGSGWKTIKTEEKFVQGLVNVITWSLYNPWDMGYTCNRVAQNAPVAVPKKR